MGAVPPPASRDLARIAFSVLAIGLLIAGSLSVLLSFLGALLWATMIVVSTWPLLLRLQRRLGGSRGAAVAVMTAILLLALLLPLSLALSTILGQSERIADFARELPTRQLPPPPAWVDGLPLVGNKLAERWQGLAAMNPQELAERFAPQLRKALVWFAAKAGSFASLLLHFVLTVAIAAILYAKGEAAERELRRFFRRLSEDRGDIIVTLAGKAIRGVAMGIVVTAALRSAISGIALFATGVPFAGFLSAVIFLLCIAQLGSNLILVPCAIWMFAQGSPGGGAVLLAAAVASKVTDNVLKPLLIKRGADLSLLLILPGVIGGLLWLGIIGLFVGPVILAVTSRLIESWVSSGLGEEAPAHATSPPLAPT
jgi:predicted PurR-regulated permease PerM